MTMPRKLMKREARREEKDEKAALLEKSIKNELLERLKLNKGNYVDIYNYSVDTYKKVLKKLNEVEQESDEEHELEYVEGYEELEEEDDIEDFDGLVINNSHADDENVGIDEDDEEAEPVAIKRRRKESTLASKKLEKGPVAKLKKRPRVLVEVEHEDTERRQKVAMIESYLRANRMFVDDNETTLSGRVPFKDMKADWHACLDNKVGFKVVEDEISEALAKGSGQT